jgi:hypothetical protein
MVMTDKITEIVSDDYRDEVTRLKNDPILIAMLDELGAENVLRFYAITR